MKNALTEKQNRAAILEKIDNLRKGNVPRVLDLFAGCGGISLGFTRQGFKISAAVEMDPFAVKTHQFNFFKQSPHFNKHAQACDITKLEPDELALDLNLGKTDRAIDVIVGGPPCQAFARVGRAKLREVAEHPKAFLNDERSNLYLRYLHFVKQFKPIALLMENVPDILNFGGHNISEEICEVLSDLGYTCRYTLLNAAYYGVPQMRERMFLIAYANELNVEVEFPKPTHWVDLPRGYFGSRQVALKSLDLPLFGKSSYVEPSDATPDLPSAITAQDAIGDLPPITFHLEGKLKRGARRFDELSPYPANKKISNYSRMMREWPGFSNSQGVSDHVIRYLPRDYKIFKQMKPGDQYPEAFEHATKLFDKKLKALVRKGINLKEGTTQFKELKKKTVPPYDPGKFPNKWRKMDSTQPARTLMAHLGKDGYSHIHYDDNQARTISVREAARLQSFPDGFIFSGSMNPAFKQIGNSVPPLMAASIARIMWSTLRKALR